MFELPAELKTLYANFGVDLPALNVGSGWELPIPATIVVKARGEIVLSYVDRDYTKRMKPSDALEALRASV